MRKTKKKKKGKQKTKDKISAPELSRGALTKRGYFVVSYEKGGKECSN